jgi:hypothetical protein
MSTDNEHAAEIMIGTPVLTIEGELLGAVTTLDDHRVGVRAREGGELQLDPRELRRIGDSALCTSLDRQALDERRQTSAQIEDEDMLPLMPRRDKDEGVPATSSGVESRRVAPLALYAGAAVLAAALIAWRRRRKRTMSRMMSQLADKSHTLTSNVTRPSSGLRQRLARAAGAVR